MAGISLSSTSQEHLSHPFFQRLITLLFSPHSYTPYKPTDFLACSTPNSSIPSTGVSATPNTTIDVDSRATTPKGDGKEDEEEVGKNMKIMVGFKIFTDSKNQKKVRIHLPVNSSGHFPVNIKHSPCDRLEEGQQERGKHPIWLRCVAEHCMPGQEEINRIGHQDARPGRGKKKAAKEDLLAKQEARAAAIKESASKKRKSASGGLGGGDGDEEGESDGVVFKLVLALNQGKFKFF
ncbi:hypothetical protein Pst134EA_005374 [Puccinia striiformis f. sp. tritici]|uniref:hypothetical protein n=1 Tax=Puccinia striiformis f. sp. tritici TaxID=168172 RepID=UPI002007287C|nr:hypothetical protein Pst134EA_005374 [Puccinia striiformis f. sp. tritici]KAH9471478.1 hypothetical protein Pst134EA_005374 [Puccinia striiformis f. sp. tritici]